MRYLTDKQYELLERLLETLEEADKEILHTIINTFKKPTDHKWGEFHLWQFNILRTFYIPSVVAKTASHVNELSLHDSDDTAQSVSKAKTGRRNNDTYVQSQVEW